MISPFELKLMTLRDQPIKKSTEMRKGRVQIEINPEKHKNKEFLKIEVEHL